MRQEESGSDGEEVDVSWDVPAFDSTTGFVEGMYNPVNETLYLD